MKRAFTLIELLVVIAIIAILAAILFPVFAQAKAAAKDTSALSNIKNLATAQMIYLSDSDDLWVPAITITPDNGGSFETWQETMLPYTKSEVIKLHPKLPIPTAAASNFSAWYFQSNSHFGMPPVCAGVTSCPASGSWSFGNTLRSGNVTGGVVAQYDGIAGVSVDPDPAATWSNHKNAPSLSATAVASPAEQLLFADAGNWEFSWGFGATMVNFYATGMWVDGTLNNFNGGMNYCGPHARKGTSPGSIGSGEGGTFPAASAPSNVNGIPTGMTTYVAADGHAKFIAFRVGITKTTTNGALTTLNVLWPKGN